MYGMSFYPIEDFNGWDLKYTLSITQKINFRQNMAIWMQPMHTHNLTQAQAPVSYAPGGGHSHWKGYGDVPQS